MGSGGPCHRRAVTAVSGRQDDPMELRQGLALGTAQDVGGVSIATVRKYIQPARPDKASLPGQPFISALNGRASGLSLSVRWKVRRAPRVADSVAARGSIPEIPLSLLPGEVHGSFAVTFTLLPACHRTRVYPWHAKNRTEDTGKPRSLSTQRPSR